MSDNKEATAPEETRVLVNITARQAHKADATAATCVPQPGDNVGYVAELPQATEQGFMACPRCFPEEYR